MNSENNTDLESGGESLILSRRQLQEISTAQWYTRWKNHGTAGHLAYNVIAKLANALDTLGVDLNEPIENNVQGVEIFLTKRERRPLFK